MKSLNAIRASDSVYELAESPVWNSRTGRVIWVDIPAGRLHSGALRGSKFVDTDATDLGGMVSAVALARDGGLLVAAQRGLIVIGPAGDVHTGPDILPPDRGNRMNDGACDASGRYLVGTLSLDGREFSEELLQVEPHGAISVLRTGIGLSNGIAFSPNGTQLYHVDTLRRTVWVADYDSATGAATQWSRLFTVDDGSPDGLAVDEEGMLWLAIWGAGQVRQYDTSGNVHAIISVDAPHTSSVAFVGADLDQLVITTARAELTDAELATFPDSGAIFLADPGARGLSRSRWAGSTTAPEWDTPMRGTVESGTVESSTVENSTDTTTGTSAHNKKDREDT